MLRYKRKRTRSTPGRKPKKARKLSRAAAMRRRKMRKSLAAKRIQRMFRRRKGKRRAKRVNKAISRLMTNLEESTIRYQFKYAFGCGGTNTVSNLSGQVGGGGGDQQWILDHNSVRTIPPARHSELMYMQVDDASTFGYQMKPTFPGLSQNTYASRLNSPFVTEEHLQVQKLFQDNHHCVAFKQFQLLPPIPPDYTAIVDAVQNNSYQHPAGAEIEPFECRTGDKVRIKNNYIKLSFNVTPDPDRHLADIAHTVTTTGSTRVPVTSGTLSNGTGNIQTDASNYNGPTTTQFPSYIVDKKEWYVDVRIIMAERPFCGLEEFNLTDILDVEKAKIKYTTVNNTTFTTATDPEKIAKSIFMAKYTDKTINPPGSEQNRERKIFKDETFRIDWKGRHKTTTKIYNLMKSKVLHFTKDVGTTNVDENAMLFNIKTQYAFIVMLHTHNCRCYVEQGQVLTFDK